LVTIHKASINKTPVYPQPALGHLFIHSQPLDGLEAYAATDRSRPYSDCLGCSQYVPVFPEIPHRLSSHPAFPFALRKEYIVSTLHFFHPRNISPLVIRAGANHLYKVFNEKCSNSHLDEAEKKSRGM